ncbi:MAG: transcription-repair coupling factor [Methylotenera sp.]|nr:transcription-repair coupling factor [Oligoflexia bacterium]
MASSKISAILQSIADLSEPIRVLGAPASPQALVIARWALALRDSTTPRDAVFRPLVILCPSDDAAAELASDMETLSALILGERVTYSVLPSWDQSLYSPIAPSIQTRLSRIAALTDLHSALPPQVIFTTLVATSQRTIPVQTLLDHSITLEVEASVETREALMQRLADAGYLRVDPVEDPGTFAVRGDIVDVFPPGRNRPLRVELFGDVIEKIREFDPESQRAAAEPTLQKVTVGPAREVLINRKTSSGLRERLKSRADDIDIPRSVRDPVLNSIHEGIYPDHSDAWGPLVYPDSPTFWEHLLSRVGGIGGVAFSDELSCFQAWDEFIEEQKRLEPESINSQLILPAVQSLYVSSEHFKPFLDLKTRLYFDRFESARFAESSAGPEEQVDTGGGDRISNHHKVFVKSNGDLTHGSRQPLEELDPQFKLWIRQGFRILALAPTQSQAERIRYLLEERSLPCRMEGPLDPSVICICIGTVAEGFRWPTEGIVLLTESDILGAKHTKKGKRRVSKASEESGSASKDWSNLQALSDLALGDAIVHVDHGIGRYQGLVRLDLSGAPSDFLLLEYANKDKLYLPVYRLNVIQKYIGAGEGVLLDRLGSQQFARAKEKVRDAVKKIAIDLIQLYAERKVRSGFQFSMRDSAYTEFEAKFPFDETPDQIKAIDATLKDMEEGKIMDRLVCGDVGYGKTEVAIRAAFRAVSDGKQVAVLVPTTVLAHQHEQSFKNRLKDYPILVDSVSRFKSAKEQKKVLESLKAGKLDIIIGTHRLLSRDVEFNDLGLIIVDEEQRFGVEHKEKLKTFRLNTSVLTLTATPIPRTLHMALSGLRDISLINTPPVTRLSIRTYVSKFDEPLIKRAIEVELNRGGQVFFLHNRVQTIAEITKLIKELVPSAKVIVGHGQMGEGELEKAMMEFYEKRANVLVCTSIIESGLDVPSANTIIVNRADAFGLSQLYQIRGRVGRGQQRAYAYLLLPAEGSISEDAKKRLEVIQRFVELGSGFNIASHDLELRGGGDLLGAQQSGQIAAVGFDLYTELLEEAIREIEGKPLKPEDSRREPEIKAPFSAFLSEEYVPDVHQRLSLYRRFSAANEESALDSMEEELKDRFGALPVEALNLMWLIRVKQVLKKIGIDSLTVGPERIVLVPGPNSQLDPVRAIALISSHAQKYQLTPDSKFVTKVTITSLRDLYFTLQTLLKELLPRLAKL